MLFPNGHFYSPVIDPALVEKDRARIWPEHPSTRGIEWNDEGHQEFLQKAGAFAIPTYESLLETGFPRFRDGNGFFEHMDARVYFAMLQFHSPGRILEIGSGHSTLLALDVTARLRTTISCVEPYPPGWLLQTEAHVLRERVETLSPVLFEELRRDDFLFIDSSHVAKTGSDVCFLLLDMLPRLREGVIIHIHDIFLPGDYPETWVKQGRSWNEQYVVQALLIGSTMFELMFGCSYARARFPEMVKTHLRTDHHGGSLYLRKVR